MNEMADLHKNFIVINVEHVNLFETQKWDGILIVGSPPLPVVMSPRKKYKTLKNQIVDESEIIQDLDLSTPQHWTPLDRGTGQHVYK